MSDGPWEVQDTGSGLFVQRTERATYFDEEEKDQAQKLCAELNKIARREAASEQMLEALKYIYAELDWASESCVRREPPSCYAMNKIGDAIRAAEGEEAGR